MRRLSLWVLTFFVALLLVKTCLMARERHERVWAHPKWEELSR